MSVEDARTRETAPARRRRGAGAGRPSTAAGGRRPAGGRLVPDPSRRERGAVDSGARGTGASLGNARSTVSAENSAAATGGDVEQVDARVDGERAAAEERRRIARWRRDRRLDRRVWHKLLRKRSLGKCGLPRRDDAGTRPALRRSVAATDESGYLSGVTHCANPNLCPWCAPVIRARRADDIETAALSWLARGGGIYMVTPTLPHTFEDDPVKLVDVVVEGWRSMLSGWAWAGESKKAFEARRVKALMTRRHGGDPKVKRSIGAKEKFGIVGCIKALEITVGEHGAHPHMHVLVFTEKPLKARQVGQLTHYLKGRWAKFVVGQGLREPHPVHGLQLERINSPAAVGKYLTKVKYELVRGDLKEGRGGHRTQFQLLRDVRLTDLDPLLETGEMSDDMALLLRVAEALHGRNAVTWSPGLRGLLLPEEPDEQTDEEIMEAEDVGDEDVVQFDPALASAIVARPDLHSDLCEVVTPAVTPDLEEARSKVLELLYEVFDEAIVVDEIDDPACPVYVRLLEPG